MAGNNKIKVTLGDGIVAELDNDAPNVKEFVKVITANRDAIKLEKIAVEGPTPEFDNESFKGYSRQVFEVAYSDDAGKEGIRFSKAYTCNGFEVYEPEDGVFRSIQIMDVDGIDVKEYGDGEKVSLLFFVKGDYSYTILCPDNPMPREDAEVFVSQLD